MADDDRPRPDPVADAREQLQALGEFIRVQRKRAQMSLRELAEQASVSNPYLSQIERGLHEPSVRVLKSIAQGLGLSAETLLVQAGLLETDENGGSSTPTLEEALRSDTNLTPEQKTALLAVYASYVAQNTPEAEAADA